MSGIIRLYLFAIIVFFQGFSASTYSQSTNDRNIYSFMFYNVENLFDCDNDPLTNDDEFTPSGIRAWNWARFNKKIDNISKVIIAAGKWNAPVLVGLCEIENRLVLEKLISSTQLKKFGYNIIHKDSPDERGIDLAFLYRNDFIKPFDFEAIKITDKSDMEFKTRDILLVKAVFNNCDTINVFINHWPSRYGGIAETMRYRNLAATTLKSKINELLSLNVNSRVVIMGDFNDTPEDKSLSIILNAGKENFIETKGDLINLSYGWLNRPVLTLKNQYSWELFDQIIVSDGFIEKSSCTKFISAEIFDAPFLMEPDTKFGGFKLKRSYIGYKYQEGFSDHLPVLIRFQLD